MKRIICLFPFLFVITLLQATQTQAQDRNKESYLFVAPIRTYNSNPYLLKGFQQIIIDEIRRISGSTVTERVLINQYLREHRGGDEPGEQVPRRGEARSWKRGGLPAGAGRDQR